MKGRNEDKWRGLPSVWNDFEVAEIVLFTSSALFRVRDESGAELRMICKRYSWLLYFTFTFIILILSY